MNHIKTSIESKENRRKRNFAIKVILLFLLELIYQTKTFFSPFLERFPILSTLLIALIFLISGNLIISLGRFITLRFYLRKTDATKVQPNFVVGIDRIADLLNVFILLISLMLALGIRPLEFLTSITIVAAALAILSKDYITNIVNGLIIMFSDQLEIGDKIQIGKNTGFIRDITLINLVLRNDAGETILIPNTMALNTEVVNFSSNNTHQVIFDSEVSSKEEIDLNVLENQLTEKLKDFPEVVFREGAQLNVIERKSESTIIRFQFPIKTGEKAIENKVKKEVNQAILDWNYEHRKS
jgi:small-conductance mechanosensitive channel